MTEKISGVYTIVHRESGTTYVGSTNNLEIRWRGHKALLRHDRHYNLHLQNAWNMYGEAAFEWSLIEKTDVASLIEREQYWLDYHKGIDIPVYNVAEDIAAPARGRTVPTEQIERMVEKNSQRYPEFVNVISHERIPAGKNLTKLCRERAFTASSMHLVAQEKQWHHKGWMRADGDREKVLAIINREVSDETRAKRSAALKGRIMSPEEADLRAKPYPAFRNRRTGQVISAGKNLERLCRELDWDAPSMWKVVRGKLSSYHDWCLVEPVSNFSPRKKFYPAFRNTITGEAIEPGFNLSSLCRELGLSQPSMSALVNGRAKSYKGWEVLNPLLVEKQEVNRCV